MFLERCSKCQKVRDIRYSYGEQPAQFVEMCKCDNDE